MIVFLMGKVPALLKKLEEEVPHSEKELGIVVLKEHASRLPGIIDFLHSRVFNNNYAWLHDTKDAHVITCGTKLTTFDSVLNELRVNYGVGVIVFSDDEFSIDEYRTRKDALERKLRHWFPNFNGDLSGKEFTFEVKIINGPSSDVLTQALDEGPKEGKEFLSFGFVSQPEDQNEKDLIFHIRNVSKQGMVGSFMELSGEGWVTGWPRDLDNLPEHRYRFAIMYDIENKTGTMSLTTTIE